MTLEQKNLILGFLAISGLDKENEKEQERLSYLVSEIIDLLPKEHRKKEIFLQSDLLDFIAKIKFDYLGFGANLYETTEEKNLDWTPEVAEKIKDEAREVEKKIA